MFHEDLDRLDGHRTVEMHRDARDLTCLHQVFDHEQKLLRTFDSEGRNYDCSATRNRIFDRLDQLRPWIGSRVQTIPVSRFHYQEVHGFAFLRPCVDHFPGRDLGIAYAADVAGEEQLARGWAIGAGDLRHS